jgi:photosystem II stability/assembly factor-like uncharacterized protein
MCRFTIVCTVVCGGLLAVCCPPDCLGATPVAERFTVGITSNTFLYGPDGDLYTFEGTSLLRLANEEGDRWETIRSGIADVAIDPRNGKIIYATTSARPIVVIKSLDKGKTWLTVSNGLEGRMIYGLQVNPANSQEVFAGTDRGLYKTLDAGFSWQLTALTEFIWRFYIDPNAPLNMYAVDGNKTIRISSDGGRTWRTSVVGSPTVVSRGAGGASRSEVTKIGEFFLVSQSPGYLIAFSEKNELFRSGDGGASWQNASKGFALPSGYGGIPRFYATDEEVFLCLQGVVYRSPNGASWSPVTIKTFRSKVGIIEGVTNSTISK